MPYLICNICEIYYEINPDFDLNTLETCEKCNGDLKYYSNFDEYYKEKDSFIKREDDIYIKDKSYNYDIIALTGFILAIIGLLTFIFAVVSPFLFILPNIGNPGNISNSAVQVILIYSLSFLFMTTGVFSYVYSKRKANNYKTGVGENNRKHIYKRNVYKNNKNPVADYFRKLPEGYFILNSLKIPDKKINIDHIVIGPTGIFLTWIKNLHGHCIINGNEWLNNKGKMSGKKFGNPSQQVKSNAIELKRFLDSKNINIDYMLINSIVALSDRNFTVRKMPGTYNVMRVEEVSNFIVNSKIKMDVDTVTGAVLLLERYCREITRS